MQAEDIAFAGGGLANVIAACRVAEERPDLRIVIVEREQRLGGNHTWSFHDTDLAQDNRRWLESAIVGRWPRQEVRFPAYRRTLETGYNMMNSASLHEWAQARLGERIRLGTAIAELHSDRIVTAAGEAICAKCVIDGRGPIHSAALALGYQKFVGLELDFVEPHGLTHPVLMDATVEQLEGFRFMYLLPLSARKLLVEDTRYSSDPIVHTQSMRWEIQRYCAGKGWAIADEGRSESAALPVVLAGDLDAYFSGFKEDVGLTGLRGLLFHPLTGYSVPDAVRAADVIASALREPEIDVRSALRELSESLWRSRGFLRLLARMMFVGADPQARLPIMQRFYSLPADLIERFYAASLSSRDKARVLCGRPPIALGRALASLPPHAGFRVARDAGRATQPRLG